MFDLAKVKGIIFDYGGTIDSNGKHWAEVLWESYQDQKVPVTKEQFREAYVYADVIWQQILSYFRKTIFIFYSKRKSIYKSIT